MENIRRIINTVLTNRGNQEVDKLTKSSHLRDDIGLDSLDLAELTVRIEAEYDIDVFEDGVVNTVGEILEKLNGKK